jgi:hypothetical protein
MEGLTVLDTISYTIDHNSKTSSNFFTYKVPIDYSHRDASADIRQFKHKTESSNRKEPISYCDIP